MNPIRSLGPIAGVSHKGDTYTFYYDAESHRLKVIRSTNHAGQPMRVSLSKEIWPNNLDPIRCYNNETLNPLAAIVWTYNGKDHIYLFYCTHDRILNDVYSTDQGQTWHLGSLGSMGVKTLVPNWIAVSGSTHPRIVTVGDNQQLFEIWWGNKQWNAHLLRE